LLNERGCALALLIGRDVRIWIGVAVERRLTGGRKNTASLVDTQISSSNAVLYTNLGVYIWAYY